MKTLIMTISMLLSVGAFAKGTEHDFLLQCNMYRTDVNVQKEKCPKIIAQALKETECGGTVTKCYPSSPGAQNSGFKCEVENSKCTLTSPGPYMDSIRCQEGTTPRDFNDYQVSRNILTTTRIVGMGFPIHVLCLPQ